jgi:hypothetical protein
MTLEQRAQAERDLIAAIVEIKKVIAQQKILDERRKNSFG